MRRELCHGFSAANVAWHFNQWTVSATLAHSFADKAEAVPSPSNQRAEVPAQMISLRKRD
jgi:hypothetical protein